MKKDKLTHTSRSKFLKLTADYIEVHDADLTPLKKAKKMISIVQGEDNIIGGIDNGF